MERIDGYAPIREYALVGDGRTAALIASDGSVDWLCLPNFDSPSVFARILDAERGGSFRLEPAAAFEAERRYLDNSNVLETTFVTAEGRVRVTDAMTLSDSRRISPMRELVRKVETLDGTVPLRWSFEPRFDYGRAETRIERRAGRWFAQAGAEALVLGLFGAGDGELHNGAVSGELALAPGESAVFSLAGASREPAVIPAREGLGAAARAHQGASGRSGPAASATRAPGRRPSAAARWRSSCSSSRRRERSSPRRPPRSRSGSAASRNWDYRFTWLRDASWALDAMLRLGYHDEAHAFFWWLMHASRLTQPRLQVLYRLDGVEHARERELSELSGYRRSQPVRIGNGAATRFSSMSTAMCSRRSGSTRGPRAGSTATPARRSRASPTTWRSTGATRTTGSGRCATSRTHYIQSKGLCWVALDRAVRLGERGLIPNRSDRWRAAADELKAWVDEHGWDDELRSLVRAPDLREVDASLLTLAVRYGYENERIDATIAAVERDLREGPYVYRYRGDDGLAGDEGAFLTCSFWLVDAYAQTGRLDDANALMEELVGLANDVGLYSEEIDPGTGDFLGNFPQGLTHLALVNAAVTIADLEAEGKERAA